MEDCDMCYEYKRCTAEKCTKHTLLDGSLLEFAEAMLEGRLWGDIIYVEDSKALEDETDAQKEERLKNKAVVEKKALDNLKETILHKNRFKNCIKQSDGSYVLKQKFKTQCENLELKDEVLSDGTTYPGGCWAHSLKICPFMHPDEKDKYEFKGKTKLVLVEEPKHHSSRTYKRHGGKRRTQRKVKKQRKH